LAEKQKYFVFGLAKNFKIQLKIMRALCQIGAGFFDGEWGGMGGWDYVLLGHMA